MTTNRLFKSRRSVPLCHTTRQTAVLIPAESLVFLGCRLLPLNLLSARRRALGLDRHTFNLNPVVFYLWGLEQQSPHLEVFDWWLAAQRCSGGQVISFPKWFHKVVMLDDGLTASRFGLAGQDWRREGDRLGAFGFEDGFPLLFISFNHVIQESLRLQSFVLRF